MIDRIVYWPHELMPLDGGFVPAFATRGGGRTQTQAEQVIQTGLGFWRAEFKGFRMQTPGRLRAWRALEARIGGRAGVISLPLWDFWQAPFPGASGGSPGFGDGTRFDDGAGFGQDIVGAALGLDVAVNATSLRLTFEAGSVDTDALIGAPFSLPSATIGDRAHRITDVEQVSATVFDVAFWPWTRGAYGAETAANFNQPRCTMRLEDDAGMAVLPTGGRWGEASVKFTEVDPS